jgi:hypothetical protein
MELFARPKPKTPFTDFVRSVSPGTIAHYLVDQPKVQTTLAMAIALLCMSSVEGMTDPKNLKDVKVDPDVFALEACVFAAFCIRYAFEPKPTENDDEVDFYEDHFDPWLNEAFKLAYLTLARIADKATGWDSRTVIEQRLLGYIRLVKPGRPSDTLRAATYTFIVTLEETQGATEPMIKYPGPISLDLHQHLALTASVLSFVTAMPPASAQVLDNVLRIVEWTDRPDFSNPGI